MSAALKLTIWEEPDAQRVGFQRVHAANDNAIQAPDDARENSRLGIFVFPHTSLPACEPANDGIAPAKSEAPRRIASEPGITGKEEDVEVGLQYFGKRYLNPLLGRWISADPLAVHAPGKADLNLYAYVKGAVLKAIDPIGLQDACPNGGCHEAPADSGSAIDEFEAAGVDTTAPSEEDVMGYLEGVQAQQEAEEAEVGALEEEDQAQRAEEGRPTTDSYGVECSGDCHQEGVVQGQTWTGAGEDTPVEGSLAPYFVQGLPILASEALSAGLLPSLELYMSTRIGMRMPRFGAGSGPAKLSPAEEAASWQGSGAYPGVDDWTNTTLQAGDIVYGGAPGQSGFYTTGEAVVGSGMSRSGLGEALQVAPHAVHGYRPAVTAYRATEPIEAAISITKANAQHGQGGVPQFFVPDYSKLEPIFSIPLGP